MAFNNQVILQYGNGNKGTITFPIAFTKQYAFCWQQIGQSSNTAPTQVDWITVLISIRNKTLSSIQISDVGYGVPTTIMWIAIGS